MQIVNLIMFDLRKQFKNIVFIIMAIVFIIFTISQTLEVFCYPVKTEKDINTLAKIGEREYIYVKATNDEFVTSTINNMKNNFKALNISKESVSKFEDVIEMLRNKGFEYTYEKYKSDEYIEPWLKASKLQFEYKLGNVEQVNYNIKKSLGENGYLNDFHMKYVTYVQICSGFIMLPIFLTMLTRDFKSGTTEIIYSKSINPTIYLICKYIASLILVNILFYTLGLIISLISAYRFKVYGWDIKYSFFIKDFIIFILPTTFYLSALIVFLSIILRKTSAILPIYIVYIIFNVTPKAFGNKIFSIFSRAVIRLDMGNLNYTDIFINRIMYIIIGVLLIIISCKVYRKITYNLERMNLS